MIGRRCPGGTVHLVQPERTLSNIAAFTCGLRQLRSGWNGRNVHRYHCLRIGLYCQAEVELHRRLPVVRRSAPVLPQPLSAPDVPIGLRVGREERER